MVRVIGIDPGTKSFDLCGLDDEKVILDRSISTSDIAIDPALISEIIIETGADIIVGPSGYGIPVTGIGDIGERELFLMSLLKKDDRKSILGMRSAIDHMKNNNLPVFFIPGVIHLPSVPSYRKINRIDMGTADKLCCAALGIRDQASRYNKGYTETSFILLEMGYGYTAALGVKDGKIVDGIGGSSGNIGYLSMGCMDAELAYLLGRFDKELIFRGGVETFAKEPTDILKNEEAKNAYIEGAFKNILALTASVRPEEVIISGRLSRVDGMLEELQARIDTAPVRRLHGFEVTNVKEAAQGAALIANGLAGGEFSGLVEVMEIKKASGTCLDYILLPEIDVLKKDYNI